jgi:hypothetical protein
MELLAEENQAAQQQDDGHGQVARSRLKRTVTDDHLEHIKRRGY